MNANKLRTDTTESGKPKYGRIVLENDIESTPRIMIFQRLLHADAPTRIRALANVLRKEG